MNVSKTFSVHLDDLPSFAKTLAKIFSAGDCVCLTGDMGAGKTTLSYFLVKAWLGTEAAGFASPTFTIMNQYTAPSGNTVNHVDLYRLENFAAFEDLDLLSEWDQHNTLTFVEWGEKFAELKPHFTHYITITLDAHDSSQRQITIAATS